MKRDMRVYIEDIMRVYIEDILECIGEIEFLEEDIFDLRIKMLRVREDIKI